MEDNKRIMTKASLEKLQKELEDLTVNRRKEIAAKIKEAREQGDLSENAEYDAAKDEQRDIEARIEELENIIKNSEMLDEKSINFDKVHVGSTVKIKDQASGRENSYHIVVSTEVNSREGKISYESPIGKALMEKEVGDIVEVSVPAGVFKYEILDISTPDR